MTAGGSEAGTAVALAARLLPRPKTMQARAGLFRLTDGMPILASDALEQPEIEALERFVSECAKNERIRPRLQHRIAADSRRGITVDVAARKGLVPEAPSPGVSPDRASQAYHLRVSPVGVELIGESPVGAFYGIQTLRQFLPAFGHDWPCVEIRDAPDYAVRGLSYDISRGRVPTLQALKELADRLAAFKANHLQLYIEHTFAFRFNPSIGRGCSPLTADDVRELDDYCGRRRIALVPSLASFGHMGHVLSLPEYRHLAEIETTKSWAEMSWSQRMHGLTLDAVNPESRTLLERMYGELLPLFSADTANVCCDETYDVGKGKSKALAAEKGTGRLYLEHLGWLCGLSRRHGKRPMFWGDMIKCHPELLNDVPNDAVVLNWGYGADADYDSTALFREAGLTTFVCPGTSAWNRVINDINSAELNIRRYAAAGIKHGAAGLLNTDWGDDGHFNLPAGSWHPIVLGAAMGWNIEGPGTEDFDRAFGRQVLGDETGELTAALRRVAAVSNMPRSWPAFYAPLSETVPSDEWTNDRLEDWRSASLAAVDGFARRRGTEGTPAEDLRELELACRMNALVADRMRLSRDLLAGAGKAGELPAERLRKFAEDCEALACRYEQVWMARNRRSNLAEILAVFDRLATEARAAAGS